MRNDMKNFVMMSAVVAALSVAMRTQAQAQSQGLVGTWERVYGQNATGRPDPNNRPAFLIFSADGYFLYTQIPSTRPKVNKPVEEMTREELLDRFRGVDVRVGTYTISGNRWIAKELRAANPQGEGQEVVRLWRIVGDELVVTYEDPNDKTENRWKRVRAR